MSNLKPVVVVSNKEILPNTFLLKFKREFDFDPGQIIGVTMHNKIPPRLYSICSAPDDKYISILYNIKPTGELTPLLSTVKKGATIYHTPVQGKFIYKNEPAWWIATGTGIAPFYSMLKSGQQPTCLVQGGRTLDDFIFQDELLDLDNYVRCCSKESASGYYEGRLTKYLRENNDLPTHINYYLCGSAEMVVDVRNILIEKGVGFDKIITEIYF